MAVQQVPSPTDQYAANRDTTMETRDRFPGDTILRQCGFVIEARPAGAPALWRRNGRLYSDRDARLLAVALRAKARIEGK